MLTGILCLAVFLVMAMFMYARRISALLALPLMAFAIALIGGVEPKAIVKDVLSAGSLKLHSAYTTTMFGAMLAELMNKHGMARALVRWVAEFAGDNPYLLGILLTAVTALLFSTLGGLGAVIMVGTIILPVMLSLGIPALGAAGLFLFGISLGGMFNLTNWQLYTDVLKVEQPTIVSFVVPFALILSFVVMLFLAIELKDKRNLKFLALGSALLAGIYPLIDQFTPAGVASKEPFSVSYLVAGIGLALLSVFAVLRHWRKSTDLPGIALFTPIIPLLFVLVFRWEIIPSFMLGLVYGVLTTWSAQSINLLTRSIIDGVSNVIPAVLLMMGIGMLIVAVMDPKVSDSIAPIIKSVVPTTAVSYVLVFALISPLALYRGPLSLWGMGSGLVSLMGKVTTLTSQAIMGMLMSVGQIQGVCDPTNTQNIWIATYLGVDTQAILRKTIGYAWLAVILGLSLSVAKGFVPW